MNPVTLVPCGHSVCKRCGSREKHSCRWVNRVRTSSDVDPVMLCRKCGADVKFSSESSAEGGIGPSTCVLISQVVDKVWAKEKKAVQLREEGNKLFQVGGGQSI